MKVKSIFAAVVVALVLGGCSYKSVPDPALSKVDAKYMAKIPDFPMDANYERYEIDYATAHKPGTTIVDTKQNFVYFILNSKKAIRYGAATGAEAHGWTGTSRVARKAEWPRWMPPADMLKRWPHLAPTARAGGLNGGPDNPLGARALYLYQGNRDTLYRIHGTNEPDKIGRNVSSGCIRMRNIDVVDLYNRTKLGATVIVR
ncbi:MAG: L,D-transpeptidase [Beijerinckiaceae bacterium]|nr:L,D-transpeptidase [Beijerinckiaceae bacterium]